MIDRKSSWGDPGEVFYVPEGECWSLEVEPAQHVRVSALLGPDGEPLRVGYQRPALGFDLRPRAQREKGQK